MYETNFAENEKKTTQISQYIDEAFAQSMNVDFVPLQAGLFLLYIPEHYRLV
jgi:hypothetical protein